MAPLRAAGEVPVERASAIDMMELVSDVGPAPAQVGAVLVLSPGGDLGAEAVRGALADRIRGVPRLRQ